MKVLTIWQLFVFACLLFAVNSCNSQSYNFKRILNHDISKFGLRYELPTGFKEVYPDTVYTAPRIGANGKHAIYSNVYEIASTKYAINICYTSQNIMSSVNNRSDQAVAVVPMGHDFNKDYLKMIDGITDTLKYELYRYPVHQVMKTWNATEAILCTTNNTLFYKKTLFQGKYDRCKVLVIHKENVADLFLYYWYNQESASVIDRVISETKGMIRFK